VAFGPKDRPDGPAAQRNDKEVESCPRIRIGRVLPVMVLVALLSAVMATSAFSATSVVKHRTASSVAGKKKAKKIKKA
jgi:hypothetical protein